MQAARYIRGKLGRASHGKKRSPAATATNLLEGTGIFESEDDWSLLESPWQVTGGTLNMPDSTGSVVVARWLPAVNPLQASTTYTVRITITNDLTTHSGGSVALMQGTAVTLTHTSGTQDYTVTSGTLSGSYILEVRENVNNFTPGFANGLYIEIFEA